MICHVLSVTVFTLIVCITRKVLWFSMNCLSMYRFVLMHLALAGLRSLIFDHISALLRMRISLARLLLHRPLPTWNASVVAWYHKQVQLDEIRVLRSKVVLKLIV